MVQFVVFWVMTKCNLFSNIYIQQDATFFFFIRAQSIRSRCTATYKAYCATLNPPPAWFRRSYFRCQVPPRPYHVRDPSSELWARMLAGYFA
jgi:hypothetical protein